MEETHHRHETDNEKITIEQKASNSPRTRDKKASSSSSSSSSSARRPIESLAHDSERNSSPVDRETPITLAESGKDERYAKDIREETRFRPILVQSKTAQTTDIVCRLLETPRFSSAGSVRKLTVLKLGLVTPSSDISSRDASTEDFPKEVNSKRNDERNVLGEHVMEIADSGSDCAAEKRFAVGKVDVDKATTATKGSSVCDVVASSDVEITQNDVLDGGMLEAYRCSNGCSEEGQQASKAVRPRLLVLRKCPDSPLGARSTVPPEDGEIRTVELPFRYRKRISATDKSREEDKENEQDDFRLQENRSKLNSIIVSDSLQVDQEPGNSREQDMKTAFEWVEQELRHMKEDDRRLARQLLELRASLHQMRGLTDCQSFNSDEYDLDPDWSSSRSLDLDPALTVHSSSSSSSAQGRLLPDPGMRIPSELVNSDSLLSTRHAIRQEFYV